MWHGTSRVPPRGILRGCAISGPRPYDRIYTFSYRLCYNRGVPLERKTLELVRVHALVRGLVQGVNFRWFTQRRAIELGLRGLVRNLPDGSVEVVAEGEREALETLLDTLRLGPSAAIIESVDAQWSAPTGEFNRFEVRH
jgi:acylphosphatase